MNGHSCRVLLLVLLIPAIGLLFGGSLGKRVVSSCVADLNHNGVAETIRLEGGYALWKISGHH